MDALRQMNAVVDLEQHSEEVNKMYKNNMKRSAGRTPDMVLEHTRRGFGAEVALRETGFFTSVSEMVDDADTEISFADRMRDLTCDGIMTSVKTMKDNYRYFYVTETQFKSIKHTQPFCDLMLVMSAKNIGVGVYRYKPIYLVDNKRVHEYIVYPKVPTLYESRIFRAGLAKDEDCCVIFKDMEETVD